ncbi:sterol desaturase family protein [Jannaschia helgolandensis]|uniref:sterol desaturase family protein n=1 Tax=Jannaschia helgolandensis TaxID=188906 RepID=UPI0030D97E5B|tara:strand:- start:4775 stop:5785 length:1011 start_codon:yes stop_codon:yes gene_type:complete
MDDTQIGERDRRGDWAPKARIAYPPVLTWPAKPVAALRWIFGWPGYFMPWNMLYFLVALVVWVYLSPPMQAMADLDPLWIAYLLARNAAIVAVFFGAFHLRLYVQRAQGDRFKFNARWPSRDSGQFLFRNQTLDNLTWTFASAIPIWTAFEVLMLWIAANGYVPQVTFVDNPVYFVVLLVLVPVLRDLHFYAIHRAIHWPPLYRLAHNVHHRNVNPGPWSGLSMHPIEHILYFSGVLVFLLIPFHPLHVLSVLIHTALSPAPGHAGFERIEVGDKTSIKTHCYAHYLHHKYFECNYADGMFPLDRWFGTFHDGSPEAKARMKERLRNRSRARARPT